MSKKEHSNYRKEQHASKKTLWITLLLTLFFTIVEVVGGILSNSLALLSDSIHMISDVFALGLSMLAIYLASRHPNDKYTFGYLRFEILASFINGLALIVISIGIFFEGVMRIIHPQEIELSLMMGIAVIGLIVNIVLTFVLGHSHKHEQNLNIQSALWHFIGDLLSSIGIIISGIIIYFSGYTIFDPIVSMLVGFIIFFGGFKIIREAYWILMERTPSSFDLSLIREDIKRLDGVEEINDCHLWTITTDVYAFTAHILTTSKINPHELTQQITRLLKDKYHLENSTIQIDVLPDNH